MSIQVNTQELYLWWCWLKWKKKKNKILAGRKQLEVDDVLFCFWNIRRRLLGTDDVSLNCQHSTWLFLLCTASTLEPNENVCLWKSKRFSVLLAYKKTKRQLKQWEESMSERGRTWNISQRIEQWLQHLSISFTESRRLGNRTRDSIERESGTITAQSVDLRAVRFKFYKKKRSKCSVSPFKAERMMRQRPWHVWQSFEQL